MGNILSIDQGTTSSRAILFDSDYNELTRASAPLSVHYPKDGWVEQDGNELLESQLSCIKKLIAGVPEAEIDGVGITNQRETILCWDRTTGEVLAPAIVWQCRRSASIINQFSAESSVIIEKTGLVLDPYFSASKIVWLMQNTPGLKSKVQNGDVLFGTVDTFLVWKLSGGKSYVTDPTNASRTMLFNIHSLDWDDSLLKLFDIPRHSLPGIVDTNGLNIHLELNGKKLSLRAIAGDQQASLYGHRCLSPGEAKCTFGTGAFLLLNTGSEIVSSTSNLISTVAWKLKGSNPIYAVEGSVFVAGSLVQWLRDGLKIISSSDEIEMLASNAPSSGGVIFVPALTGLGAPYWRSDARGAIHGITRDTTASHIARASLEGVAHMVCDLLECAEFQGVNSLSVDGGMSKNSLFIEILADFSNVSVIQNQYTELTALGVALMASNSNDQNCAMRAEAKIINSKLARESEVKAQRSNWKQVLSLMLSQT